MLISNKRKNEPYHYMMKIESFSLLSEAPTIKIESDVFEASGHNWRLDLYPSGNEEENGDDHISLYLIICGSESLPKGWEVYVNINFFIYDHIHHKYENFEDILNGNRTKFHEKKLKWGFDKMISLDSFKNCENGYLSNDSCVFGVEIFATKEYYTQKDRCLSMTKPPPIINTHTWTIDNFLDVTDDVLKSEIFKVGKVKWRITIYPKGNRKGKDEYMSIYLEMHDTALLHEDCRVFAKFELRIKNQNDDGINKEKECCKWFDKSDYCWGFPCFMLLKTLGDPAMGFLLNGRIIVEAEILLLGTFKNSI